MSVRPPDWKQREAALDTEKSFIVEAPAGSGKTALLIQRYLKLLLHERVTDPAQVLAITFTVKATEEIRNRVLDKLLSAQQNDNGKDDYDRETLLLAAAVNKRDAQLGWQLLEQPSRMNIRSIDSLASEIARTLPILSGGFGALSPSNSPDMLYRTAARRTLMQMGGKDTALHQAIETVLLHRDASLTDVEMLLAGMLEHRDQWMRLVPLGIEALEESYLDSEVLPRLDARLQYELCTRLTRARLLVPDGLATHTAQLLSDLCECDGYQGAANPLIEHFQGRATLPGDAHEEVERWKAFSRVFLTQSGWRKTFSVNHTGFSLSGTNPRIKKLKAALEELRDSLQSDALYDALDAVRSAPSALYPRDQWPITKALLRLLRHALGELKVVFAEEGVCDFTEVSLAAQAALQSNEGAQDYAAALGVHLQHLVMDEMQDTSFSQYELLKTLTAGWDGHSQTVFLVGDPKQSIYIFREARVELFNDSMKDSRFGDIPLEVLRLTANFRSQQRLVEAFNTTFSSVFAEEDISYTPADAMHPPTQHTMEWRTAQFPYSDSSSSTTAGRIPLRNKKMEWESDEIVRTIAEWRADPAHAGRHGKIAVLVRSRSHARPILEKLRDAKIPAHALEIDTLMDRPEVLDLVSITRALLHPADRTAFLAVLHAPWCGAGLADLHLLAAGDDSSQSRRALLYTAEERLTQISPRAQSNVKRTLHTLQRAMEVRGRLPLSQWIEKTWRTLGGDAYLNASEMANARSYFEMLDAMEAEGREFSIAELERRLQKLFAESDSSDDAVQVLTIHKAKGLEWDLVLVPSMERKTGKSNSPLLDWAEMPGSNEAIANVLLAPIAAKGNQATSLNAFLRKGREARELAEVKRLLYVAATRAAKSLHLFGTVTEKKEGSIAPVKGTLLHAAWSAAEEYFSQPEISFANVPQNEDADVRDNVLQMPQRSAAEPGHIISIAATAPPQIQRFPADFNPEMRFAEAQTPTATEQPPAKIERFKRPQGSFLERAVGDTVHVFMEQLSLRATLSDGLKQLNNELPQWKARIQRYAQSHGLAASAASDAADTTMQALETTLSSTIGHWILQPHPEAQSEMLLRVPSADTSGEQLVFRVDRTFLAGEAPSTTGTSHRWIVDFKTGQHHTGIDEFLDQERKLYQQQMHSYAQAIRTAHGETRPIMLALYYPRMDRIVFWKEND